MWPDWADGVLTVCCCCCVLMVCLQKLCLECVSVLYLLKQKLISPWIKHVMHNCSEVQVILAPRCRFCSFDYRRENGDLSPACSSWLVSEVTYSGICSQLVSLIWVQRRKSLPAAGTRLQRPPCDHLRFTCGFLFVFENKVQMIKNIQDLIVFCLKLDTLLASPFCFI